jgi:hypothetical protein
MTAFISPTKGSNNPKSVSKLIIAIAITGLSYPYQRHPLVTGRLMCSAEFRFADISVVGLVFPFED